MIPSPLSSIPMGSESGISDDIPENMGFEGSYEDCETLEESDWASLKEQGGKLTMETATRCSVTGHSPVT